MSDPYLRRSADCTRVYLMDRNSHEILDTIDLTNFDLQMNTTQCEFFTMIGMWTYFQARGIAETMDERPFDKGAQFRVMRAELQKWADTNHLYNFQGEKID